MRVRWSRKALLNLDYAVEYIAADNPTAAAEVAQRIWDISQMLADQPGMVALVGWRVHENLWCGLWVAKYSALY